MNTLTHPAYGLLNVAAIIAVGATATGLFASRLNWTLPGALIGATLIIGIVSYFLARLKLDRAEAALQAGCARAAQERDGLEALRDQLIAEAARQVEVRALLAKSRTGLEGLKSGISVARARLETDSAALAGERVQLEAARSLLASDNAELIAARAALAQEREALESARMKLVAEHSALIEARAALGEQKNALMQARATAGRASGGSGAGERGNVRGLGTQVVAGGEASTPFAMDGCDLRPVRSVPPPALRLGFADACSDEARDERSMLEVRDSGELLGRVHHLAISGLNVPEILESLAHDLARTIPWATVVAFTMNECAGKLELMRVAGMHCELFSESEVLKAGLGVAGRALAARQRLLNEEVIVDLRELGLKQGPRQMRGNVFPLLADQSLGVIGLFEYDENAGLSWDQVRRVEELCHLAVPALQNAQLRLLAITDGLTGLSNARHLMREGARLVKFRSDQRLSLLMMDLDGFKQVNDTYGHDVGDELLVAVARSLQPLVRPDELLSRKGGDEFVMILNDSEADTAQNRVELVRQAIRRVCIKVEGGREARVGVSIGVARSPDDCTSLRELMRLADTRMYKQKRSATRWPTTDAWEEQELPFDMSA